MLGKKIFFPKDDEKQRAKKVKKSYVKYSLGLAFFLIISFMDASEKMACETSKLLCGCGDNFLNCVSYVEHLFETGHSYRKEDTPCLECSRTMSNKGWISERRKRKQLPAKPRNDQHSEVSTFVFQADFGVAPALSQCAETTPLQGNFWMSTSAERMETSREDGDHDILEETEEVLQGFSADTQEGLFLKTTKEASIDCTYQGCTKKLLSPAGLASYLKAHQRDEAIIKGRSSKKKRSCGKKRKEKNVDDMMKAETLPTTDDFLNIPFKSVEVVFCEVCYQEYEAHTTAEKFQCKECDALFPAHIPEKSIFDY